MSKKYRVIVLGGSGVVGSIAVKTLSAFSDFSEVVIGDINTERANEIIKDQKKFGNYQHQCPDNLSCKFHSSHKCRKSLFDFHDNFLLC